MQEAIFSMEQIPKEVHRKMLGNSLPPDAQINIEDLRYLQVMHYGFDGKPRHGELIVNRLIGEEILDIMKELFQKKYPIEKMVLMDAYGGDDNRAMADNNSSAFNYRLIAGTSRMSWHSLGLAIDINPLYNPYIRPGDGGNMLVEPEGSACYADRTRDFPYKIDDSDLCCCLFKEKGYTWGGDWTTVKDYQHFQKTIT